MVYKLHITNFHGENSIWLDVCGKGATITVFGPHCVMTSKLNSINMHDITQPTLNDFNVVLPTLTVSLAIHCGVYYLEIN